ncbi:hypothetical protein H098_10090 [Pseudomonas fluorescens FH5]|nr:hypothetical protein H098_10090 [Pseudomonas fluorescens FH5]
MAASILAALRAGSTCPGVCWIVMGNSAWRVCTKDVADATQAATKVSRTAIFGRVPRL